MYKTYVYINLEERCDRTLCYLFSSDQQYLDNYAVNCAIQGCTSEIQEITPYIFTTHEHQKAKIYIAYSAKWFNPHIFTPMVKFSLKIQ